MSKINRLVIGLTGGIATGKSSALAEFKRRGAAVVSSDDLAHRCLTPGHPVARRVSRHFGTLDRKKIGKVVFNNPRERRWLERQIHPEVIRQLKTFIRKHRGLVVLDIPLLFEARLERLVDRILVITSRESQQLERMRRRDGLERTVALRRIRAQLPLAKKLARADDWIPNTGTRAALRRAVADLVKRLPYPK
jgi:dephospho-CoA kinase